MEPIIGYSVEELAAALTVMEAGLKKGEFAQVQLCTSTIPTDEDLELVGINMVLAGFHASEPQVQLIDGIPTTSFVLRKGSPEWALLIPIIIPVLTIGLITFGIFRLESITKALIPILLIAGGVVVITAGLLARPAERITTRLLERKAGLPEQAYVASTVPSSKPKGPASSNPYEQLNILPQTELREEVRELWRKACEWEGVPPESKFVVFSDDNPYMPKYREAMLKLLRFKQFESGQWQPATAGEEQVVEIPFAEAPGWVKEEWNRLHPGTKPRVKVHRGIRAEIHMPYADWVVRDIVAYKGGQTVTRYVPGYESLLSSTPEEQKLYFGGAVNLMPDEMIAVMDSSYYFNHIDLYAHPQAYEPPRLVAPVLTERQRKILATIRAYTSSYRREVFERNKVTQAELDELNRLGLIDKRGAITIMGRNIVAGESPLDKWGAWPSSVELADFEKTIHDIALWYAKNRRQISEQELHSILEKRLRKSEDREEFLSYLKTTEGYGRLRRILRFELWKAGLAGPSISPATVLPDYMAETTGKFFITQISPRQIKVTRSDRRGEFFIDIGFDAVLPEGPYPSQPATAEEALLNVLQLTREEARRVEAGIPEEISDSDPRADRLWDLWEDLEAESSLQTIPKSAIPEPYSYHYRRELRKIPTTKLLEAYNKLKGGEPTGMDLVEKNRALALSAIEEVLWERGKLPKEEAMPATIGRSYKWQLFFPKSRETIQTGDSSSSPEKTLYKALDYLWHGIENKYREKSDLVKLTIWDSQTWENIPKVGTLDLTQQWTVGYLLGPRLGYEVYQTKTKLPPEWTFLEEEPEPILEVTPGMLPPTQTVEREKGWKDFYKGNRVQASIDSVNWRLKARNVSEEEQKRLHESLKTDWKDLVEYQNLQAWGFASGLLAKEEAQQLYQIYGGESPSPEKWDKLTLAEKVAGTRLAGELLGLRTRRMRSPQTASPSAAEVKHYWVEKNLPYESWAVIEVWPGGLARSPFKSKEEAIKCEQEIWKGIYELKLVPSPQEKFPAQHEALKKLYPYEFIQYHDDGDITIQELVPKPGAKPPVAFRDLVKGNKYVVTTDGEVFVYHTPEEALKRITGESQPATIEGSRILPFAGFKDNELVWTGLFPDTSLAVKVKGFVSTPKTVIEAAFRGSRAILANIIPNRELPLSATGKGEIWWHGTIDNIPVEVHVTDIEIFSELELQDMFNSSIATITGVYQSQTAVIPTKPTPEARGGGGLEYIADSPEYLAQTIDMTGWRQKIDQVFQEAVERVKNGG